MKIVSVIILLFTLAACRTGGGAGDSGTPDPSVMGPEFDSRYCDEGGSFEIGGTIFIDAYSIHRPDRD